MRKKRIRTNSGFQPANFMDDLMYLDDPDTLSQKQLKKRRKFVRRGWL